MNIISTIETDITKVGAVLISAFEKTPSGQTITSGLQAIEAELPGLAETGLQQGLAVLGEEAIQYTPLVISYLQNLATKIEAKIASLAPAAAASSSAAA